MKRTQGSAGCLVSTLLAKIPKKGQNFERQFFAGFLGVYVGECGLLAVVARMKVVTKTRQHQLSYHYDNNLKKEASAQNIAQSIGKKDGQNLPWQRWVFDKLNECEFIIP